MCAVVTIYIPMYITYILWLTSFRVILVTLVSVEREVCLGRRYVCKFTLCLRWKCWLAAVHMLCT